jgi:phospholipase A1
VSDGVNTLPTSANAGNSVAVPLPLNRTEAKFQLSVKTKVAQGLFGDTGDIWFGYTQSSRWQVYNEAVSRPFRETNYEPEAMLVMHTRFAALGWNSRLVGLGFNHQSNGRAEPLSRSWNRVIAQWGLDSGPWQLMLRPWWRVKEASAVDDNPGIQDYLGRGDVLLTRAWGAHLASLHLRHSLRGGERSRGSAELEWAFPIAGNLRGRVQLFSGYGESLIDYNFRQTRIGLGVSLTEWR